MYYSASSLNSSIHILMPLNLNVQQNLMDFPVNNKKIQHKYPTHIHMILSGLFSKVSTDVGIFQCSISMEMLKIYHCCIKTNWLN